MPHASSPSGLDRSNKPDDIQPIRNVLECGFLDYIGLASYAASHVDSSPAFIKAIDSLSADGPGSVLGLSRRYQAQYSALLNGTLVHSMDWDDTNSVASLHPGASSISAVLAQAELETLAGRKVTGREFYTALAVGYEVTCRLGRSISDVLHRAGFHPTSVAGVFGAAAVAGKLAGFQPDQFEHVFGVVGSMASGSLQCFVNGGWNKKFHMGIAAHNALVAVQFVKAGVMGAMQGVEGQRGLLYAYGGLKQPDLHIIEDLGTSWETRNTAIKPYPCCRLAHAPIEAAYALRKHYPDPSLLPKDLRIEVTVGPKAYGAVGIAVPNKLHPTNIVEAQFSLYFQFAVAWLHGRNDWTSYALLHDENILAFSRRITVFQDDSLRDGSLVTLAKVGDKTVKIKYPLGEPENPMEMAQVKDKFRPMAEEVFGVQETEEIVRSFRDLENQDDISVFIEGLRV